MLIPISGYSTAIKSSFLNDELVAEEVGLTEIEKLRRDAEALIEAIRLDWRDLAELSLTPEQRAGVRAHIQWAQEELSGLLSELDE